MARSLRILLTVLALGSLVAACGGDDKGDSAGSAKSTTSTTGDGQALTDQPCQVLDVRDISAVTGLDFDKSTPSTNQCVYTSSKGLSAIALNLRQAATASAAQLAKDKASCASGTETDIAFAGADGGFGCVVADVPTVVAIGGDGVEVILTASSLNAIRDPKAIITDLSTILKHAIEATPSG